MEVIFLKKVAFIIILIIMIFTNAFFTNSTYASVYKTKSFLGASFKPPVGSKTELYQDIFVTLLDSCISEAIKNYYHKAYAYEPYDIDILNVYRPNGYRTFDFLIQLQVMPYVGAHNIVGVDNITIEVSYGIGCKVKKFEHLKNYPIP
jgi:hypothetical protein